MTDLLRPEPGRTRSILSGIMNFAKWRYVKPSAYLSILTVVGRISRISSQLCNTKSTLRRRGMFALALQCCSVLMCRMERLRKEVAAIEDEIDEIK